MDRGNVLTQCDELIRLLNNIDWLYEHMCDHGAKEYADRVLERKQWIKKKS